MARTRYIKPDFFTDEDIADLPLEARLIFIGLWCHADRKGRLEDRPKFFKVALAPYDNIDTEAIIGVLALAEKPFIKHYEVNGKRYIQIINFEKHQRPHHTERDTIIPDPKKGLTVKERLDNGYLTVRQRSAPLYSSNGDGDGDGDGNGEGEGEVRVDKREREDKAAPPLPFSGPESPEPETDRRAPLSASPEMADGFESIDPNVDKRENLTPGAQSVTTDKSDAKQQYPENDIMAVGKKYCDLQGMVFVSPETERIYLRGRAMFYPAKDLLGLNLGNVARAQMCLKDLAGSYKTDGKDWNWNYVLEDFIDWDQQRAEWEEKYGRK